MQEKDITPGMQVTDKTGEFTGILTIVGIRPLKQWGFNSVIVKNTAGLWYETTADTLQPVKAEK